PAQVAEIITRQGVAALNAQAGLVALVTDEGANLKLVHAVSYPANILESWQRFPIQAAMPLTDAVRLGEPILIESPEALASRYPQLATMHDSTGNSSVAAIPLSINGQALGVLGLSFATAQAFT